MQSWSKTVNEILKVRTYFVIKLIKIVKYKIKISILKQAIYQELNYGVFEKIIWTLFLPIYLFINEP